MPNKRYVNGRRKEYKTINELRDQGFIAFRTAGSHSPFDVIGVNEETLEIVFIQCKPSKMSEKGKQRLLDEHKALNKERFTISFRIV